MYPLKIFYSLAIAEGEGVGTAYEYSVKARLLNKIIKKLNLSDKRSIAVLGLPEKYGVSLDILLFAKDNKMEIAVYDEREEILNKLKKSIVNINDLNLQNNLKSVNKLNKLTEIINQPSKDDFQPSKDDILVNSDVFQRLTKEEMEYILFNSGKISNVSIFFMPNADNINFVKNNPNRKAITLKDVLNYCMQNSIEIRDYGYIDMPPFPSGYALSKDTRNKIKNNVFIDTVFFVLYLWGLLEIILPGFIRRKFSHAFYVVI